MSIAALLFAVAAVHAPVPAQSSVAVSAVDANEWIGIDIRVEAWNRPEVSVEQQTIKGNGDDVHADISRDGDTIRVTGVYTGPRHSMFFGLFKSGSNSAVRWIVHVPSSRPLQVRVSNGPIGIAGVTGALDAQTSNGRITVSGAGPNLRVSTSNGSIDASIATVAGGTPHVELHTSNGNITLHVPRGFNARVETKTSNGVVNNPLSNATGGGTASARTSNGNITIVTGS